MKSKSARSPKRFSLPTVIVAVLAMVLVAAVGYPWVLRYIEENSPSPDVTSSNEQITGFEEVAADEVLSFVDHWIAKTVPYGSWVHIVSRVDSEEDNGVTLPNGKSQPNSYLMDDWFYLNDAGLVEKGVQRVMDFDGNVLQQGVFINGVSFNQTFDTRMDQQPYEFHADFGFANYIKQAEAEGIQIFRTEEVQDGRSSIVFTYVEVLEEPVQMGNQSLRVKSIRFNGFFDKETNDLWLIQIIWTLENGEERLFNSTQILSLESAGEPDAQILEILEGVK